jgi:hypothetical protein
MTNPSDQDDTVQADAEPETTVVASDISTVDRAELAWSLDDTQESDTPKRQWRGHLLWAGLVTLLCAIVAVVTWFSITLYHQQSSRPMPSPASSAEAPAPKPVPPPPTATVTVVPAPAPNTPTAQPAPTVVPSSVAPSLLSSTDRQFLAVLQNMGLGYPSPDYAIAHAHATCDYMAKRRITPASATDYVARTTIWVDEQSANMFANYSAVNYCPQFASE